MRKLRDVPQPPLLLLLLLNQKLSVAPSSGATRTAATAAVGPTEPAT